MLGAASAKQDRFNRQSVPSDGKCLFWAILDVLKLDLTEENNKNLRVQVAKYIFENEQMHLMVSNSVDHSTTIEQYCSDIENGKLWAGEPEVYALAMLINKVICVTYLSKSYVRTAFFGDETRVETECVYLVHENSHYDLLIFINKENPSGKKNIFKRKYIELEKILDQFIDEYKLASACEEAKENPSTIDELKESEELSTLFIENPTLKRKQDDFDENLSSTITFVEQVEEPISNEYYKKNKRTKVAEMVNETILTFNEINSYSNNFQNIRFSDCTDDASDVQLN